MSFFEIIKKEEDLDEVVEEVIDEDTEASDDLIVERDDLQDAFESAKKFYNGILSSFNKLIQIREGIEFIKDGKKIKSFSTKTDIKSKISRKEMQTLLTFINYVKGKDDDFTVANKLLLIIFCPIFSKSDSMVCIFFFFFFTGAAKSIAAS